MKLSITRVPMPWLSISRERTIAHLAKPIEGVRAFKELMQQNKKIAMAIEHPGRTPVRRSVPI